MYSQNSCLPNKRQPTLTGSLPQNLGLLRNFTSKSLPKFADSTSIGRMDFEPRLTVDGPNDGLMTQRANIFNFVYSFRGASKLKLNSNYTDFSIHCERPTSSCKQMMAHYDTVSTMPFASSHLVGGFVGSKSQLGRRPAKGFGVKMWDIIRELVDLFGSSSTNISSQEKLYKPTVFEENCANVMLDKEKDTSKMYMCNNSRHRPVDVSKIIESGKGHKQSYAEVTKAKLLVIDENISVKVAEQSVNASNYCSKNCKSDLIKSVIEPLTSMCSQTSPNRDRITSECSADSEDSFIVFEYCEEDDNSIDESSSSSDDESTLDFLVNEESSSVSSVPSTPISLNKPHKPPRKKVRFAEGKDLAQVRTMVTWDYAYRNARKGPWEMLARDSERFKCRIASTEAILAPVLDTQHRQTVFQQRFSVSCS